MLKEILIEEKPEGDYDVIVAIDKTFPSTNAPVKFIVIGTQSWAMKNVTAIIPGDRVFDDDENNRAIYGGLYDFSMIEEIEAKYSNCRVPTKEDWEILIEYLEGAQKAGGHLKEIGLTHWLNPNTDADNSSGFTALPGGIYSGGDYHYLGERGQYMTKTTGGNPVNGYSIWLNYDDPYAIIAELDKVVYQSVRLIKK